MTILSNHRFHSYKASTVRHRDISPKKMPIQPAATNYKKKQDVSKTMDSILRILIAAEPTKHLSPTPPPTPSAPPAVMASRTIYVRDDEYVVHLPIEMDLYDGLKMLYPSLYDAVIQEDNEMMSQYEPRGNDDDYEEAWAHYDYLEYLYD
jgi:hypothetical protein